MKFISERAQNSFETMFIVCKLRLVGFGVPELGKLKEQVSKE